MSSLGIIGGGFSGLSTLAALVRHAPGPLQITVYSPEGALGRGKAYSTQDPNHLLNVRAGAMGVHAGEDDDFFLWLVAENIPYEMGDFAPRAIYGRYLDSVLAETLLAAQAKEIRIFTVHEKVSDILSKGKTLIVRTVEGYHEYEGIILACGNDRPRVPTLGIKVANHAGWWKHPYMHDRWTDIQRAGHVIIIGSGLSMIDALVTLKRESYESDITVVSRHGFIPHPHPAAGTPFSWDEQDALQIKTLSALVRQIRLKAALHDADWRDVLDGLRPYANDIWRNFSAFDRKRAQRYMSFWNMHRHRIPQVMHDLVHQFVGQGQLRLVSGQVDKVEAMGSSLNVYTSAGVKEGQIVINCLGYDYRIKPDDKNLLAMLVNSGFAQMAEGFPRPVDDALRLHQTHALYGVGPMWQGFFIESTAVRDIRLQADMVAQNILKEIIA